MQYVGKETPGGLSDALALYNEELARRVFWMMEATDWRFLPSQILAEDFHLMRDLWTLRARKNLMERLEAEEDER